MDRRLLAVVVPLVLMGLPGIVAGEAQAVTLCAGVTGADCAASYPATGDGVQQALSASDTIVNLDGSPNTVRIGAGTFTRTTGKGFVVSGAVIVAGQGRSTVLEATSPSTGGGIDDVFRSNAPASTLRDLVVRAAGRIDAGVRGFTTVSDVRVTGTAEAFSGITLINGARGSRLVIDLVSSRPFFRGVLLYSSAVLEDAVVRIAGANARGVTVSDVPSVVQPATVRHVTILGDSAAGTRGADISVPVGSVLARVASLVVRDSIIRGVAFPLAREGHPGAAAGTANLSVRYSSWDAAPAARIDTGPGTFTVEPGNVSNPDPLFVDPLGGDLRLFAGSPLLDAGDPAAAEAGDSPTDVAGAPRIAGGRRDVGAYAGGVPIPVVLPVLPASPGPVPASPDTVAPVISGVRLSRATFRVGAASTAISAARRRAPRPGGGTTVAYRLSEAATVTITVERTTAGLRRRPGGACARPTAPARRARARPCTLRRVAGTLTRRAAGGANVLAFSGRIGRRKLVPGRYRLTLAARDAAGNASRPLRIAFRIVS